METYERGKNKVIVNQENQKNMKRNILYVAVILLFFFISCVTVNNSGVVNYEVYSGYGSPNIKQELANDQMFIIREYATDNTYGYTQENPIMVGGVVVGEGPSNERRFLNALAGPSRQHISYQRIGSCCRFHTDNGQDERKVGLLDKYEIYYEGLANSIILYINMYDSDTLKVPVGFSLKYRN